MDLTTEVRRSGTPLVFVRDDSTISIASRAAEKLWGVSLEGARLVDLLGGSGREDDLLAALRTGASFAGLIGVPGGHSRLVLCTSGDSSPASREGDGLRCFAMADVTDDFGRVVELEAANQRSLALLDAMPDMLFRVSSDLRFLDYRDPTTKGLGLAPEDFLGKKLADFLAPEIVELVEPNLVEALATDRTVTYPSYFDYEDGRHTFENRVVKSGPEEVVLICRDTTDQTRAEEELRRNQARLHRIVEYSREYTSITDRDDIITFISPPVERVLGYAPEELIGTNALDLVHPDDLNASRAAAHTLANGPVTGAPLRVRLQTKDGGWRLIEATGRSLFHDGLIGGLLTHCRDVTDYADVEQTLRDSLSRLDAIVETAADGIVTVNAGGFIESINSAAQAMFQCDIERGAGICFEDLLDARSRPAFARALDRARAGDPIGLSLCLTEEIVGLRRDGTPFPVTLSASFVTVQDGLIVTVIVRDVSEQRALELQLEYQATHDALTGLPNRSLFMASLERAVNQAGPNPPLAAVFFLDLDRFKVVNDSLGHAAGDKLICAVASRLSDAVRGAGSVARFGGDEFLILCRNCKNYREVEKLAERVLRALDGPLEVGHEEVYVSASAGIATFTVGDDSVEAETIIRNADTALYRAKTLGRGRYELYDARVDRRSHDRLSTETALRRALERGEFATYFQPIWGLKAKQYVGTEALIRWHHDGELIPPSKFIGVAEETGVINEIGAWILRDACAQTVAWQQALGLPGLTIAVNVSGCQLDQPKFPSVVADVLSATGISPSTLILEITESKLIQDDRATLEKLRLLRATGVRLAIDDFGTGYSSLGYLRQLPVDIIKVDRCFISQIVDDPQTTEIVKAITTLAHKLGMTVVGEGIETAVSCEC